MGKHTEAVMFREHKKQELRNITVWENKWHILLWTGGATASKSP